MTAELTEASTLAALVDGAMAGTADTAAEDFVAAAARLGREVLAPAADDVDATSRFPREAIDAMRAEGMLGAIIPVELGGLGLSIEVVSRGITEFGKHCSSAGMVFAMHTMQVACLVNHGSTPELLAFTERVAREGLLVASATTEVGIGGNTRTSTCAVETEGTHFTLRKQAPVISYGEYADAILATARRDPDAPAADQVLVLCRKGSYELEPTSEWDALGFRGTCSRGFVLTVSATTSDVLPVPFADISARTMLPSAHVLWSSLWLGMSMAAESKARKFVQKAARRDPSVAPPGALRLSEVTVTLQQLRHLVEGARRDYEAAQLVPDTSIGYAVGMNAVKIAASTMMVDIVQRSMVICGIMGYANRSPFSLGRLLRDSLGSLLMVNNDRIHGNSSNLLLVYRGDA